MSNESTLQIANRRSLPDRPEASSNEVPRASPSLGAIACVALAVGSVSGWIYARQLIEQAPATVERTHAHPIVQPPIVAGAQQGEGIRTGQTVPQGGTMKVEVGTNDTTVEVSAGSASTTTSHRVAPNKVATIPVPPYPPGTVLKVTVGHPPNTRVIYVEVVAPAP